MAGVTPGVLAPLLQKDGLNFALINLKVEGRFFSGSLLHAGNPGWLRYGAYGSNAKRDRRYQDSHVALCHRCSPPPAAKQQAFKIYADSVPGKSHSPGDPSGPEYDGHNTA
jgi:hypothetical protein